jgi:RNA polymerase sigma-70 factor (ECF subfamily)
MRWAVEQLRPKYKELIRLRYFEEFSYEEIANELGISINNVKIQLFRAKAMLTTLVENLKHNI